MNKNDTLRSDPPEFSAALLQQLHRYCLKYSDLVRSDRVPNSAQSANFRLFSKICYEYGVAHERI